MRIKVLLATFLLSLGLFVSNAQAVKYWGDTLLTDEAVDFKEQASSPTNPSTDRWKLYFKSDGSLYKLDESGVETELASKASEIQDSDGDTKIQTEEGADDDTIRFDAAGSEVGTWTSSLFTTTTPLTVGGEVKTTGIEDSDGDTAVKVEESADEDIIRFDVAGSQKMRLDSTGLGVLNDSPSEALDVTGNIRAYRDGANPELVLLRTDTPVGARLSSFIALKDRDDAGNTTEYVKIQMAVIDPTNGSEDGDLRIANMINGSLGNRLTIRNGVLVGTPSNSYQGDGTLVATGLFAEDKIGVGTVSPDASALLDMVSTTKGLGVPSMTGTQRDAISTPRDGLVVHNSTTDTIDARLNSAWESLATTSAGSGTISCETVQASTSGTSIDFTSLPSSIRRLLVVFDGVSLSGTDEFIIQIGDSGGLEASGYLSAASTLAGAIATTGATTGFNIRNNSGNRVVSGTMVLVRVDGNDWDASHSMASNNGATTFNGGGSKTLSAELDRVSIGTSGSNTFDAGQINVCHEL